jgi:hypothetical protein
MKITQKQAEELAAHLIELEVESTQNNVDDFFLELTGWNQFGKRATELVDNLTSDPNNEFNSQAIKLISESLIEDFKSGEWEQNEGGLYHYMMPTIYGGIIEEALTKQMHMNSGIGIQLEIF